METVSILTNRLFFITVQKHHIVYFSCASKRQKSKFLIKCSIDIYRWTSSNHSSYLLTMPLNSFVKNTLSVVAFHIISFWALQNISPGKWYRKYYTSQIPSLLKFLTLILFSFSCLATNGQGKDNFDAETVSSLQL